MNHIAKKMGVEAETTENSPSGFLLTNLEMMRDLANSNYKALKVKNEFYYDSPADFLLKEGQMYESSEPFTEKELKVFEAAVKHITKPKKRQCYYNAQNLFLSDRSNTIKYCEGMCLHMIPTWHGFNILNGKVIDVTWTDDDSNKPILGTFTDRAYHGVLISRKHINHTWAKKGTAESIIDNWQDKYPLLKKKFNY